MTTRGYNINSAYTTTIPSRNGRRQIELTESKLATILIDSYTIGHRQFWANHHETLDALEAWLRKHIDANEAHEYRTADLVAIGLQLVRGQEPRI